MANPASTSPTTAPPPATSTAIPIPPPSHPPPRRPLCPKQFQEFLLCRRVPLGRAWSVNDPDGHRRAAFIPRRVCGDERDSVLAYAQRGGHYFAARAEGPVTVR